jgi:hypothetical protein
MSINRENANLLCEVKQHMVDSLCILDNISSTNDFDDQVKSTLCKEMEFNIKLVINCLGELLEKQPPYL